MCGKRAYCWKTRFTGRRFAGTSVTSFPFRTIRPASGSSKPATIRSVVVLPQPLGPSSEKNSPSPISSVTSSTARCVPKRLLTPTRPIAGRGSFSGILDRVYCLRDPVSRWARGADPRFGDKQWALLTHRERLVQHVSAMPPGLQDVDLSLVDSLVVPASLHDVDGRFVHLNAAAERAIGFSRAQLLGRHFTEPVPQEARKNVAEQFPRAVECGEPTDFETVFIDASGQLRGVRAQHLPLCSGDAIVGVLILAFAARRPPSVGLDPQPRLTPRQREILNLIAAGLSTSEMAEKLSISTETVRNHLRSIFTELDVHTRLEAIATAQRLGLLAPPALGPQPPSNSRSAA